MISDDSPILDVSERTSLHESDDEKPPPVDPEEEELEVVDTKAPMKKSKRHSTRKSTAAVKEAKEAKEAAAAKVTPGWATTFMLDGVQYVLKDVAGHLVSSLFLTMSFIFS